jgi:hypothetical protein
MTPTSSSYMPRPPKEWSLTRVELIRAEMGRLELQRASLKRDIWRLERELERLEGR